MERAVARIDFEAIRANCTRLKAELGDGAELCAVVKADGYGHGADGCANAALAGGATRLAVATAGEAEQIGRRLQHIPLLTMGALTAEDVDIVLSAGSEVAVWREDFRRLLADRARAQGRPARVHVKYDSGMGRLGNPDPEAVLALARACDADPSLQLAGVWTHFATADEPDSSFFDEQLGRFEAVAAAVKAEFPAAHRPRRQQRRGLPRPPLPLRHGPLRRRHLRPRPLPGRPRRARPGPGALAALLRRRRQALRAGASAGYGQRWRRREETWVGVVPLGYGDGVRRGLSNNAEVLVGGRRHPLVGTVSMDNMTIDLGPETEVEPGDEAVLIGPQGEDAIRAEEVAARLDTINYEVTCGISARVPRRAA